MDRLHYENMPKYLLSLLAFDYPKPSREDLAQFLIGKIEKPTLTVDDFIFTRTFRIKSILKRNRAKYFKDWKVGDVIEVSFSLGTAFIYANGAIINLMRIHNQTSDIQFIRSQRVTTKYLAHFEFEKGD